VSNNFEEGSVVLERLSGEGVCGTKNIEWGGGCSTRRVEKHCPTASKLRKITKQEM
jgi:hypothetical protein